MKFLWFNSHDSLYTDWLALRHRILREPLGLSFSPEDLAAEKDQRHLLAFEGETMAGGLITAPLDNASWKVRQVAIDERFQKQGLGRKLMTEMESAALREGVTHLILHSRAAVIPFYEKLGFSTVGPEFEEVGLPHRKMIRDITGGG